MAELDRGYGRFMQPDPIGYADGLNWYAYVGGDPVNATDPTGTLCGSGGYATGSRIACYSTDGSAGAFSHSPATAKSGGVAGGYFVYNPGSSGSVTGSGGEVVVTAAGSGSWSWVPGSAAVNLSAGMSPLREEVLKREMAESQRKADEAARKVCARAIIEGGRDNVVGGAAIAGAGAGVAFEAGSKGRAILNAPYPLGRLINVLKPTAPALLFGAISGWVIGAVQSYQKEPLCH